MDLRLVDQVQDLRIAGLEPARLLPLGPKPSVSTNSTISASSRISNDWVIVGSNH